MKNKIVFALVLTAALTPNSYAYLDPGTGSMIIQVAIGMIGAVFLTWNRISAKIKEFLKKKKKDE